MPTLPTKPEVIKVKEPQATPCPREIPPFVLPPGSDSDDVDREHQRYIRQELLPIIHCFVKGTVAQ